MDLTFKKAIGIALVVLVVMAIVNRVPQLKTAVG